MEDIDKTIKKAQGFICVVQNSCDFQRHVLEQLLKDEFSNFRDKWKSIAVETEQNNIMAENKEQKTDSVENLKEELDSKLKIKKFPQAEVLLRKTRIKELLQGQSVSDEDSPVARCRSSHPVRSRNTMGIKHIATNGICSSKSDPVLSHINHFEMASVQRSQTSSSIKPTKKLLGTEFSATYKEKLGKRQSNTSSVSKMELSTYRSLPLSTAQPSTNHLDRKLRSSSLHSRGKKNGNESGNALKRAVCTKSGEISSKEKKPTMKDFRHAVETNALENVMLKPNLFRCLWYPIINTSNAVRLSLQLTCSSYKELQHVYTLYHQIQETLYWLDLFTLVGQALHIQPPNSNNQNYRVIQSYLKSVFHENLQRTPVILPPDAS